MSNDNKNLTPWITPAANSLERTPVSLDGLHDLLRPTTDAVGSKAGCENSACPARRIGANLKPNSRSNVSSVWNLTGA